MVELRSRHDEGVSLRISPSYGNARAGVDQLWENGVTETVTGAMSGQLSAVIEYRDKRLGAPYSRVEFRDDRMDFYAGLTFRPKDMLDLKTEAIHRESKPGLSLRARALLR